MAPCPGVDTLDLTKLDHLVPSSRDAKDIVDELTCREVKLSIGDPVHDPRNPVGKLLFNVLAMVAEFAADLIRHEPVGDGRRQGEGKAARKAAQAPPTTGSTFGFRAPPGNAHDR